MDYQQCSVAPYLLGLPLLTSLPHDELPQDVPKSVGAPIPPPNHSVTSGEVTVRSAPEAWRASDSPRCTITNPPRLSSSSALRTHACALPGAAVRHVCHLHFALQCSHHEMLVGKGQVCPYR